jgi:hypothetical protein
VSKGKSVINGVGQKLAKKLNDQLHFLGGLEDQHIKFITFFVKEKLGFSKFRFEIKYLETPKRIIIHLYTVDGQELWCKPKPADMFDKMVEFLNLEKDWKIEYAKKTD